MISEMSAIVELRRRPGAGMFAVTYRAGRRRKAMRVPDGMIVERADAERLLEAPRPEESLAVAIDGGPATIHHVNLGLVAARVGLEGVYLLPGGEVAAVYGAEAVAIGPARARSGSPSP